MTGAEKALSTDAGGIVAITMGVITATFGGVIRDLLGGESPVILRREIYATAALLGAGVFVFLTAVFVPREVSVVAAVLIGLSLRGASLRFGWTLPRYRPRPGRGIGNP